MNYDKPYATWVLSVLLVLLHVVQIAMPELNNKIFILRPSEFTSQPWTILTHGLGHSGYIHLLFNGLFLFLLGPFVELTIGLRRFLVFCLLCILAAGVAQLIVHRGTSNGVWGFSSATSGILMGCFLFVPRLEVALFGVIPMTIRTLTYLFLALTVLGLLDVFDDNISHLGHLAGAVMGFSLLKWPIALKTIAWDFSDFRVPREEFQYPKSDEK